MTPSSNTSPAPLPRRLSCDRCHYQKLRCTRTGDSQTSTCNRCIRQNAQCVYSSSLPKGRPSMYRLANERRPPASPKTASSTTSSASSDVPPAAKTDGAEIAENSMQISESSTANDDIDQLLAGAIGPSWMHPMEWNDMQIDTCSGDEFLNLLHHNPPTPPSACFTGSQTPMFELFESATTIAKSDPDVGIAQLSQLSTRLYPIHRRSCSLAETAGSSGQMSPDMGQQHKTQALIDDNAFIVVAKWLVQGVSTNMDILFRAGDHRLHNPNINPALQSEPPTTGETLNDLFAASHHLLEILRLLQSNVTGGNSNDMDVAAAPAGATDFWRSITPQSTDSNDGTAGFGEGSKPVPTASAPSSSHGRPSSSSEYSSTVVRHLVIACHTLLLNIYIAVLIALQHDVDLRNSSLPAEAAALADMRLVLVVQLCSYLIKRQHQAVDVYLSFPNTLTQNVEPSSPSSNTASGNGEVRSDLELEVQQRLSKLRQTLRI
ncbi:uncharacterized protein PODANS_5_6820 [Podospora anserina S mat+]|uniref:Podospora anserina S mat+ genomic DNA chromosome 5, supercontig 8 n=1 Tax=Podospora anserina (strain S / ATCC MYA-4624 / DSM 980 / FGSC 10383) TaxID=515849 RepID=B2AMH5_PODAN|nr:uncharacterized protein PODANS_5_6820 [Podospora anserina S mat+]CAP65098.1 unnamed protein product [Podospora anserina S mat+]CDP29812.1 Putative protein of unknown function [Podospora anserina S mat+]